MNRLRSFVTGSFAAAAHVEWRESRSEVEASPQHMLPSVVSPILEIAKNLKKMEVK
jgi:hypothetical protein